MFRFYILRRLCVAYVMLYALTAYLASMKPINKTPCCLDLDNYSRCIYSTAANNCVFNATSFLHIMRLVFGPPLEEVTEINFDSPAPCSNYTASLKLQRNPNTSYLTCADRLATMSALYKILIALDHNATEEESNLTQALYQQFFP